jgi:methylglutaconyl-CoA hydratase
VTQPSETNAPSKDNAPSVLYAVSGAIATVTLNRPDLRNRLSPDAMVMTREFFEQATMDPVVRVIIITGVGNTFCSGADLSAATSAETSQGSFVSSGPAELVKLLRVLMDCPKVTIARVQGHVAAGGNGIVASCDIAIAVDEAKFAFSEVRLGLAPAVISVPCLAVMNRRDAQELLLTGDRMDAARALRAGLITSVVASDTLDAEVDRYCSMLTLAGPQAMGHTKELLRRIPKLPRDEGFEWASTLSAEVFASPEGQEGMSAFLEKRSPMWVPNAREGEATS